MPFFAKLLAEGQLPNAKGTLYTCPTARTAYIRMVTVYNSNVAAQDIFLYVKRATSRVVYHNAALATLTADRVGVNFILNAGDVLEGVTTTAAAVDYTVHGAEET